MLQENNNCVIDTEMRDIMGKSVYIAGKTKCSAGICKGIARELHKKRWIS